ncbi:glycosyltransferase [Craterilacuibacter sp. RT1T]|uniref:MraY family glycosyltransferase n=1 Tax=Craterilacuibacter sp. RT1T TaxID=2942211 RepID=UPI0020C05FEF|nr:glycosyltransferase [Craterilacuibacter sp. RT1T]MCL6263672.1 glycosyltransferase [Craterilacuibacter sp. RT1T]
MLLTVLFCALLASLAVGIVLIRTQNLHARLTMDHDLGGVQKFHATPTPRIGGVPMLAGLLAGGIVMLWAQPSENDLFWGVLLAGVPVFIAGLVEDLTKKVSPLVRLLAAFISAAIAMFSVGGVLPSLGIAGVDTVLALYPAAAMLLTVFAVGGVCHSVNIIDGYNGLMGGVVVLVAGAIAIVSLAVGDIPLLALSLAMVGTMLGFLVWNFPRGLIFAGDAGAYLAGFILAELAVLLVARHPGVVSPWFPLLLLIYPVFETLFSIWRRKKRQAAAGLPDSMHFHQMIYKRLVRWMVGSKEAKHMTRRNSLTAPYLWGVALCSVIPALLFWRHAWALQLCALLFVTAYIWAYRRLVTFRAPRRLVLRKVKPHGKPALIKHKKAA